MDKIRVRIIKKDKTGITLSANKHTEPVKMSWDEFNANYKIEDHIWAVMNEEMQAKYDKGEEYINNAVLAYLMGNSGGPNALAGYALLSESIDNIMKLFSCTMGQAMNLVRSRINALSNPFNAHKKNYKRQVKESQQVESEPTNEVHHMPKTLEEEMDSHGSTVMEDNPELMKLRAQMEA